MMCILGPFENLASQIYSNLSKYEIYKNTSLVFQSSFMQKSKIWTIIESETSDKIYYHDQYFFLTFWHVGCLNNLESNLLKKG